MPQNCPLDGTSLTLRDRYGVTEYYQCTTCGQAYMTEGASMRPAAPYNTNYAHGSLLATGSTLTDGTGTFTGSVVTLLPASNTVACTLAGTAVIHLPAGCTGTAATGTMVVDNSPVSLVAGDNTITTSGATGNITVTINHIAFSWGNPHSYKIIIDRVFVYLTTAGGTGASVLDVGVTTAITTAVDNLIDGLNLNTTGIFDNITDKGTNGKTRQLLDETGGTTTFVTGAIKVAIATNLVGTYIIEYRRLT